MCLVKHMGLIDVLNIYIYRFAAFAQIEIGLKIALEPHFLRPSHALQGRSRKTPGSLA